MLGRYGTKEDIPSLLYGLQQQTDTNECTYQHCLDALRNLSGASPADTYADWTNWWVVEKHQPVPDWHPAYGLVSWRKFTEQKDVTNRSKLIRSETNLTPSATGPPR